MNSPNRDRSRFNFSPTIVASRFREFESTHLLLQYCKGPIAGSEHLAEFRPAAALQHIPRHDCPAVSRFMALGTVELGARNVNNQHVESRMVYRVLTHLLSVEER